MVHVPTKRPGTAKLDSTLLKRLTLFSGVVMLVAGLGWLAVQKLTAAASSAAKAPSSVRYISVVPQDLKADELNPHELEKTIQSVDNVARAAEQAGVSKKQAGPIAEHLAHWLQVQVENTDKLSQVTVSLPTDCGFDAASRVSLLDHLGPIVFDALQKKRLDTASEAHGALSAKLQWSRQNVARLKTRFDSQLDDYLALRAAATPNSVVIAPPAEAPTPPVAVVENRELVALLARRTDLLERFTTQHPDVIEIEAQIRDLQAKLPPPARTPSRPAPTPQVNRSVPVETGELPANQLRLARRALESAETECEQIARSERDAWEQLEAARISTWQRLPASSTTAQAATSTWLALGFVAVVSLIVGALAMGYVRVPGKTYRQAADLHHHLGLPVLGVLPAEEI